MENWKNGQLIGTEPDPEPEPEIHPVPPTIEEQILALQNALISQKISGGGITTVTDSSDNRIKDFKLFGKSEQVTATGVNLIPFPYTDKDMSKNGVTFEVQQDGGVNIYGTATESVDFFLSMLDYGNDSIFNNGKGNGKILSGGKNGVEIEYHGTNKRLYLTIAKGKTVNTVIYPQLQNGSTSTPYEPYTGGKPSPSPDYPQEIKNVGKWNPEKQKYEVDVKVTGKNLFDIEKAKSESNWLKVEGDGYIHFPIRVKNGSKVTFSYDEKLTTGKKFYLGVSIEKTGSVTNWLYHGASASLINNKCTIVSSDGYVNLLCNKGAVQNFIDNIKTLQIEISDVPTEYQPYKEQICTLSLDQPLRGIDDYKDIITRNGIERNVKRVVLNGSENWYKYENSAFVTMNCYGLKLDITDQVYKNTTFCNRLKWNKFPADVESQSAHSGVIFFTVPKEICPNLEAFKQWLAQTETILEYQTTEPMLEELSAEDKEFLTSLYTYYPTTVITADGGEVNPDIEVTYIADTKNYIDQKIAAIGKTVVETQKALL